MAVQLAQDGLSLDSSAAELQQMLQVSLLNLYHLDCSLIHRLHQGGCCAGQHA